MLPRRAGYRCWKSLKAATMQALAAKIAEGIVTLIQVTWNRNRASTTLAAEMREPLRVEPLRGLERCYALV